MVTYLLRIMFPLSHIILGKKVLMGLALCVWIWSAEECRFLYYTMAKTMKEIILLKPNGQEILLQKSMNWSQYRVVNPQRSLWITNRYVILSDTHTNNSHYFELIMLKPIHSIAKLHSAFSKRNKRTNEQIRVFGRFGWLLVEMLPLVNEFRPFNISKQKSEKLKWKRNGSKAQVILAEVWSLIGFVSSESHHFCVLLSNILNSFVHL